MKSLVRSLKSICYYKYSSAVLAAVFLIITVLLSVAVSASENVERAAKRLEENIGADLNVRKTEAEPFSYYSANYFELDKAEKLLDIDGIDRLEYTTMSNAAGVTVSSVFEQAVAERMAGYDAHYGAFGRDYWGDYEADGLGEARTAGDISLIGVFNLEDAWEFKKWGATVIEGTGFTEEDMGRPVAVVSERFQRENQLEIGDEFTLADPLDESRTLTLEMIGVHSDNSESDLEVFSPVNYIYIPAAQGLAFSQGKIFEAIYHTTDPGRLDELRDQVEEEIEQVVGEDFDVHKESRMYLMAASPLNGIKNICGYLIFITSAVLALMLVLLTAHRILNRRTELGVWLSMGEKKGTLTLQLICETLLPVFAGIGAGAAVVLACGGMIGERVQAALPSFEGVEFVVNSGACLWLAPLAGGLVAGTALVALGSLFRKKVRELL